MEKGQGSLFEDSSIQKKRSYDLWRDSGYGSTCDASHITATDPQGDGAVRAMRQAMRQAKWLPEDVDYINAHGTSTELNDKMEAMAINTVFGDHTPKVHVNSTKSMIGHCLGAAGALETIAAIQTIAEGVIHPTRNYETPEPECAINVVGQRPFQRCAVFSLIALFLAGITRCSNQKSR